jgi:hypothetical protein
MQQHIHTQYDEDVTRHNYCVKPVQPSMDHFDLNGLHPNAHSKGADA